jgi:hypothetical protein
MEILYLVNEKLKYYISSSNPGERVTVCMDNTQRTWISYSDKVKNLKRGQSGSRLQATISMIPFDEIVVR